MKNHPMRRSDREITNDQCNTILLKSDYGILSTIGKDGFPYGIPLNYVYQNNKIYFHCAKDVGHKIENIENSNKICFTVVGETQLLPEKFSTNYESVIVFGEVQEIIENKKDFAKLLIDKYSKDFLEKGYEYVEKAVDKISIFEINIIKISGKARTGN